MDTTMFHFHFPLSLRHVSYHRIMTGSISLLTSQNLSAQTSKIICHVLTL